MPTRITSYNVCYTKLLRVEKRLHQRLVPQQLRVPLQREAHPLVAVLGGVEGVDHQHRDRQVEVDEDQPQDAEPRITSYNVCYTKLLRALGTSCCFT